MRALFYLLGSLVFAMVCPDPTQISGPPGERLTIPNHFDPNGSQVTHPAVVHVPGGWNGFEYWMAVTPYPGGDDAEEDPNIVASDDGITWVEPPGITNPIDDQPGSPGAYNSDPDLRLVGSTMYLFWRTYDPAATGAEENLYYSTSTDGTTWATKILYYTSDETVERLHSPSMLFESGAWIMWAVDTVPEPNEVVRLDGGADPEDAWSAATAVDVGTMQTGKMPWHLSIIKHDDCYIGLLNDTNLGQNGVGGDLLFITSDDGLSFTNGGDTVIPRDRPDEYDNLYRATLIPETVDSVDGFRVWYSAYLDLASNVWNVYRTWIGPPPPPAPPLQSPMFPDVRNLLPGSHNVVFSAIVLEDYQTGASPFGFAVDILDGEVTIDGNRDIQRTGKLRVPGQFGQDGLPAFPRGRSRLFAPFGNEVFIRYGFDIGFDEPLWVSLGYYRFTTTDQDDSPFNPIDLTLEDRMATIIDSELLSPRSFEPPMTVGDVFDDLVREIYPEAVIEFDDITESLPLDRQVIAEKSRYEPLKELADAFGKIVYWNDIGVLRIESLPDPNTIAWEIRSKRDGVLINAKRRLTRKEIHNAVVVEGEAADSEIPVRAVAIDADPTSPTFFGGRFGKVPTTLKTPLVTNQLQAENVATQLLRRQAIGAPFEMEFDTICNPAMRPFEAVRVTHNNGDRDVHVLETVTIPLDEDKSMTADTRERVIMIVGST